MASFFDSLIVFRKFLPSRPKRWTPMLLLGALLAFVVCNLGDAQATTITFQQGVGGYTGTGDTYIYSQSPTTNFGSDPSLNVFERETGPSPPANFIRDLIRYDLSSLAPGTIVHSATLTLEQVYSGGNLNVANSLYVVAPADKSWTESSATWNNVDQSVPTPWAAPGLLAGTDYDTTPVAVANSPAPGGFDSRGGGPVYSMALALNAAGIAAIQDWINTPTDNSGFFMRQPDGSFSVDIFSSANGSTTSDRPLLTLDVTFVPEPSSCLLLSLGAVGLWAIRRRRK